MPNKDEKCLVSCDIDIMKLSNPELTYIELCLIYANENGIDAEEIHKYISESLYQKIEIESANMNLVKANFKDSHNLSEWL